MPQEWNEASIENVIVANNSISVHYKKENNQINLKVDQTLQWDLEIVFPANYQLLTEGLKSFRMADRLTIYVNNSDVDIQLITN